MVKFFYISIFLLGFKTGMQDHIVPVHLNKQTHIIKFNPDGYYFPKSTLTVKGYSIDWLAIFMQDNPKSVAIRVAKTNGKLIDVQSYKYRIDRDSSFFYFSYKPIGEVSIEGKFTGKNGPFEDNIDYETIVFKGKVIINSKSSHLEMTWFEGD